MTRRRNHIEISMFPFLSVLCTVIGVLVLFIVLVLSTRVIEQEELYQQTEEHRRKPVPGEIDAVEQGIDPKTYDELSARLQQLRVLLADREVERSRISRKLSGLEDLIEYKKTQQLDIVVSRGREFAPPEEVVVVEEESAPTGVAAGGYKVKLKPIIVEVSSTGYTVHPDRRKFPAIGMDETSGGGLNFDAAAELKAYLQEIDKKRTKEYLVFLLHPNGVEAFQHMRLYLLVNHDKINVGWEPFSREWIVVNDQLEASRAGDE